MTKLPFNQLVKIGCEADVDYKTVKKVFEAGKVTCSSRAQDRAYAVLVAKGYLPKVEAP